MTDLTELAKRLVKCKHFRWMPGMRWRFDVESHRNVWSRYTGSDLCDDDGNPITEANPFDRTHDKRIIIDLSDAATKGCLLQLVRDALNKPISSVVYSAADDGWYLHTKSQFWPVVYDSEEEAMVVALESAS